MFIRLHTNHYGVINNALLIQALKAPKTIKKKANWHLLLKRLPELLGWGGRSAQCGKLGKSFS